LDPVEDRHARPDSWLPRHRRTIGHPRRTSPDAIRHCRHDLLRSSFQAITPEMLRSRSTSWKTVRCFPLDCGVEEAKTLV
jgi:hypothetical protein